MTPWRLALLELRHRWAGALLVTLAVSSAVGLSLAAKWVGAAASRETRRVQRDLGFNLRVLPREADLDTFLLRGYDDATMPQGVVDTLAGRKTISYNHLVATLQREIELGGRAAVLTGVSDTLFPSGKKKPPMQASIAEQTTQLGSAIAARLGVGKGDTIELLGHDLKVEKVIAATGGADDLRVWVNLAVAQRLLGEEGRISEVRAIDCLCLAPEDDPQTQLRNEIESAEPGVQVVLLSQIATARARQRQMTDLLAEYATPAAALAGGLAVAAFGVANVRQRRQEFAVLRTLGKGPASVTTLVLLRAALCGVVGAVAGWGVAAAFVDSAVPAWFPVTGAKAAAQLDPTPDLWAAMGLTLVVVLAASIAPVMLAVSHTPALALRDE